MRLVRPGSDRDAGWQPLHPLTPVLRSGRYFLPLLFALLQPGATLIPSRLMLPTLLAALALGAAAGWASWTFTRFRVGPDVLELRSGVVRRTHRRLPLSRLESIDLKRSLVARSLGLAELHVEAVSTGDSEVVLSYLDEDAATALRATLLARRAGVAADAPPPPETVLATVPTWALVVTALAGPAVALAGVIVAAAAAAAAGSPATGAVVAFGALPPLAAVTVGMVVRQEALYGFTLAASPDGLRIRRGLLNLRTQTIPTSRLQAISVVEPLLWRPASWTRVVVDVAGYRGGERTERAQTSILLPVLPRALVAPVLARVLPRLDLGAIELAPADARARWRAPIAHRSLGVSCTPEFVVARRGRIRRVTDVVPHAKVQSLRVTAGAWQRRLGLASLHVDTAGTAVRAVAPHRDAREALTLAWRCRRLDPTRPLASAETYWNRTATDRVPPS